MARIRIPCLVAKRQKNGALLWYWQPSKFLRDAGWRPLTLGKDEGIAIGRARRRNEDVELWKAGGQRPQEISHRRQAGTFGALVQRYRKEVLDGSKPSGAPRLRPSTRANYETSLARLEEWAGKQPLDFITPARIRVLRDTNARPIAAGGLGHSTTFNMLRVLRQLFTFAENVDLIPRGANPAARFELGKPPARRALWEADDEAAFIAAAYDLGRPGMALAIELALYTAQREGDLIAFTEAQLRELDIFDPLLRARLAGEDGRVMGWCLAQGKTSTEYASVALEIPLEPVIRARVEAAIRINRARDRAADPPRLLTHVLIDDRTGRPWKKRAFIDSWQEVRAHAVKRTGRESMQGLVWHDLRRTRVVRLRRRGMPKESIASITGHSLRSIEEMLRVYGPVDANVTAAAIVGTLDPLPAKDEAEGPVLSNVEGEKQA